MNNYPQALSGKMMDLANFIIAGVVLGQIGFRKFYLLISIIAFVAALIIYLVSYFLYQRGKE